MVSSLPLTTKPSTLSTPKPPSFPKPSQPHPQSQFHGLQFSHVAVCITPSAHFHKRSIQVTKGKTPPTSTLKDLEGEASPPVILSKFKGKVRRCVFSILRVKLRDQPSRHVYSGDSYQKFKKAGAEVVGTWNK